MSEQQNTIEQGLKELIQSAAAQGNVPVTNSLCSILLKNYKTPGIRAFVASQKNASIVNPTQAATTTNTTATGSKRWFPSAGFIAPDLQKKNVAARNEGEGFMKRFRPDKKKHLTELVEQFEGDKGAEVFQVENADVSYDPKEVDQELIQGLEGASKVASVEMDKIVQQDGLSGSVAPVITLEDVAGMDIENIFAMFGDDLEAVKKWANENLGASFGKHGKKAVVKFLEDRLSIED